MTDTRRVEHVHTSHDFFDTGWNWFLPRQAMAINIVLSTATTQEIDGPLDRLIDISIGLDNNLLMGGLDAPLAWSFPDEDTDNEEDEPDPEQQAIEAHCQEVFETAVTDSGRRVPATLRELFDLLADLGVCSHITADGVERWRLNLDVLALGPDGVLPLPEKETAKFVQMRWNAAHEPIEQAIIRYLCEDLDYPEEVLTSIQRLADVVGVPVQQVRETLPQLLEHGEFRIVRGTGRDVTDVDPGSVADHARFRLIPDWERFSENRISIHHAPSANADTDD